MSEATRDAYVRACIELDAATKALEAAQARAKAAREACESLEAALGMTELTTAPFPPLDCVTARRALALVVPVADAVD